MFPDVGRVADSLTDTLQILKTILANPLILQILQACSYIAHAAALTLVVIALVLPLYCAINYVNQRAKIYHAANINLHKQNFHNARLNYGEESMVMAKTCLLLAQQKREWLLEQGLVPSSKTVVIIPVGVNDGVGAHIWASRTASRELSKLLLPGSHCSFRTLQEAMAAAEGFHNSNPPNKPFFVFLLVSQQVNQNGLELHGHITVPESIHTNGYTIIGTGTTHALSPSATVFIKGKKDSLQQHLVTHPDSRVIFHRDTKKPNTITHSKAA